MRPAIPEHPADPHFASPISFRHPGYKSPHDILFYLPRLDRSQKTTDRHDRHDPASYPTPITHDEGRSPRPAPGLDTSEEAVAGVHHRTALVACQIVADNSFHGYLATDRDGLKEVTTPPDAVLTEDTYWFIASRDHDNSQTSGRGVYPVTPRFEDWVFPHDRFAASGWLRAPTTTTSGASESPISSSTTAIPLGPPPAPPPSRRCIISSSSYALHRCHIIPSAQTQWFAANAMTNYGRGNQLIDNEGNIVYMQHHLHSVWDDNVFALVPKGDVWTVHVLSTPSYPILEFADVWHNISLQKGALDGQSEAYLFAKFAQAIFKLLKPFIAYSAVNRYVARLQVQAGDVQHEYEVKREWVSSSSLRSMYSGGGSRSASASSSRKRSRSQALTDLEDEDGDDDWYDLNVIPGRSWVSDSEESVPEEYRRGRSRKRRQRRERSAHTVDTMPSLTDTSVVDVEDTQPGSKDSSFVDAPPADLSEGHKRHLDPVGGGEAQVEAADNQ